MAYAITAGLPPICGIYTTFFTISLYVLFGTSRHISTGKYFFHIYNTIDVINIELLTFSLLLCCDRKGTYAIVGLLVITVLNRYQGVLYPGPSSSLASNNDSSGYLSEDPVQAQVMIAMSLGFIVGIFQVKL